jgi:osmotically-inducible protein OsmY
MMQNTRDLPSSSPEGLLSSTDLAAAVEARLRESAYLELRRLSCNVHENIVRLKGHVSSYYMRQIAQTLLEGLDGATKIDYQLEVIGRRLPREPLSV